MESKPLVPISDTSGFYNEKESIIIASFLIIWLSFRQRHHILFRSFYVPLARSGGLEGAVFLSDRGCQYNNESYRRMLRENGIRQSMSRAGCPFDNACAESFFATAKKECLYLRNYATISESKKQKAQDAEKASSDKHKGKVSSENHAPHNNQTQNKQAHDAARKMGLNKKQEEELHSAISGMKWSYKDILAEAGYIKNETK